MLTIGLCGQSGSGKGTVCAIMSEYGILHVDADAIYHSLISHSSECTEALRSEFGNEIINPDGSVNRRRLADLIFVKYDKSKHSRLNTITHHFIIKEIRRVIAEADACSYRAVCIDAPLLFESGLDGECDTIVCVIADENTRIRRIVMRDGISEHDARRRIAAQISSDELCLRSDYIINNSSDIASLRNEVENVVNQILK